MQICESLILRMIGKFQIRKALEVPILRKNNHLELNQTAFILPDEQPENLLSSLDENIG